jgi:tetratricopeptide (TPR) repeat protein
MSPELMKHKRQAIVGCVLAILLAFVPLAGFAQDRSSALALQLQIVDPQLAQKVTDAFDYHNLAIACIKKGEMDLAVAATRHIIQLHLPTEFEENVAESLSIITDKLAEVRRFDISQMLLDEALKVTEQNANRVKLLKTKSRLYLAAGDNDKAIESWRKALELESRRGR